jgi:hypothetical protein
VKDCTIEFSQRAGLVKDIFQRCIDARLEFNSAIKRCASKGWPDRKGAIDVAFRAQEAMLTRLMTRLTYLIRQGTCADAEWRPYATTSLVQKRVQEDWTDREEAALARSDVQYAALNNEIESLKKRADPTALEEPYRMMRRDPELIAAAHALDRKVRALDDELSISN